MTPPTPAPDSRQVPDPMSPPAPEATFTRAGLLAGLVRCLPVAVGVAAYGLVFGVLTRQAGLSPLATVLMGALVFAGAAQTIAVGLWAAPLPVVPIILTTAIVNARNLLLGSALRPWLGSLPPRKVYPALFLLADENWALSMGYHLEGGRDGAFLLGSGLALYVAWIASTLAGNLAGAAIPNPAALGLDFAFTAVFLSLLVGMWRGRASVLPWLVAGLVAVAAAHWLPGKWYILLGGLAGCLTGALPHAD
jgi:4-azaleucine resistance transporter AzlC